MDADTILKASKSLDVDTISKDMDAYSSDH